MNAILLVVIPGAVMVLAPANTTLPEKETALPVKLARELPLVVVSIWLTTLRIPQVTTPVLLPVRNAQPAVVLTKAHQRIYSVSAILPVVGLETVTEAAVAVW